MIISYDFIYLEFPQSFLNVIDGLKKKYKTMDVNGLTHAINCSQ